MIFNLSAPVFIGNNAEVPPDNPLYRFISGNTSSILLNITNPSGINLSITEKYIFVIKEGSIPTGIDDCAVAKLEFFPRDHAAGAVIAKTITLSNITSGNLYIRCITISKGGFVQPLVNYLNINVKLKITNTKNIDISKLTFQKMNNICSNESINITIADPLYMINKLTVLDKSNNTIAASINTDNTSATLALANTDVNINEIVLGNIVFSILNPNNLDISKITVSKSVNIIPGTVVTFTPIANYKITALSFIKSDNSVLQAAIDTTAGTASIVMPSENIKYNIITASPKSFNITNPDNIEVSNLIASKLSEIIPGEEVIFTVDGDFKIDELTFETL